MQLAYVHRQALWRKGGTSCSFWVQVQETSADWVTEAIIAGVSVKVGIRVSVGMGVRVPVRVGVSAGACMPGGTGVSVKIKAGVEVAVDTCPDMINHVKNPVTVRQATMITIATAPIMALIGKL